MLSLLLANAGIDVVMLDAEESIDSRPRAAHYAPSAIRELKRAGVLDDVRTEGFIPGNMCWRRLDGSKIVEWEDSSQRNNPEALTVLHIADLLKVLLRHVEKNPRITVKFHHNVTSVSQNEKSAWAIAKLQDGKEVKIEGDYLTGCDGSNSIVRRTLFGDKFEGHTWNTQIIATNVSNLIDSCLVSIDRFRSTMMDSKNTASTTSTSSYILSTSACARVSLGTNRIYGASLTEKTPAKA